MAREAERQRAMEEEIAVAMERTHDMLRLAQGFVNGSLHLGIHAISPYHALHLAADPMANQLVDYRELPISRDQYPLHPPKPLNPGADPVAVILAEAVPAAAVSGAVVPAAAVAEAVVPAAVVPEDPLVVVFVTTTRTFPLLILLIPRLRLAITDNLTYFVKPTPKSPSSFLRCCGNTSCHQ